MSFSGAMFVVFSMSFYASMSQGDKIAALFYMLIALISFYLALDKDSKTENRLKKLEKEVSNNENQT